MDWLYNGEEFFVAKVSRNGWVLIMLNRDAYQTICENGANRLETHDDY